jgi:hypothetical protein
MKEVLFVCGLVLIFMIFMYIHLIESYKERVAYLEEELKDYQDFILSFLNGSGEKPKQEEEAQTDMESHIIEILIANRKMDGHCQDSCLTCEYAKDDICLKHAKNLTKLLWDTGYRRIMKGGTE